MKVYLISKNTLEDGMSNFLSDRALSWAHDNDVCASELVVEAAGRVCYMSFSDKQYRKTNQDYISNILHQGHDSVLEHANFTILVDGLTRALSHQLVRHRIGFAYSQLSQQYHDESDVEFIQPKGLDENPGLKKQWLLWCAATRSLHDNLRGADSKVSASAHLSVKEQQRHSRSMARSVLPNATHTTIMITGNARAWRHLLSIRGAIAGDTEMREYCIAIYHLLLEACPSLFSGFEVFEDQLGKYVRSASQ
ncbi:FAD-dependent thymidylate synthase [Pseudomonas sp. NPDC078416]|uniref:FAD-dependent thymidylate synthase n=1 Tax=Pseudomonas sp. NPDC078416 TaxID=3390637 RepID=UPI003D060243